MNIDAYLLRCSVSASVRQTVQIQFEDMNLPEDVIDTLVKANSISIRPNLSNALKAGLDKTRSLQRLLYDRCTISHGDEHFLHPDFFDEAMSYIDQIKEAANEANAEINQAWHKELELWTGTVDNFFSPLIKDPHTLRVCREAYLQVFPLKEDFTNPISVNIVGPFPANLEVVDEPLSLQDQINNTAAIETSKMLEAAKAGSKDRCFGLIGSLVDDLDARPANKVGDRVLSTNEKKRGSWQIAFQELTLAAAHNPMLKDIAKFVGDLIECGKRMQGPKGAKRIEAREQYIEIKQDIRNEAKKLLAAADSSKGFEALQMSLSLSNQYENLIDQLKDCDSQEDLDAMREEVGSQSSVFKFRARNLERVFASVQERVTARSHLESTAQALENVHVESEQDCDF